MGVMLLRVNREGAFSVLPVEGLKIQCGKLDARQYTYLVTLEATDRVLTPEGYLIDNAELDAYWKRCYDGQPTPEVSCEVMARAAVLHFETLLRGRGVDVRRVFVKIKGQATPSHIEAEWRKEDA